LAAEQDQAAEAREASHRGHRYIQIVLRGGLVLATILMTLGMIAALSTGQHAAGSFRLDQLLGAGLLSDRLIAWGLLVLALTPVFRVLALVILWLRERDRRFALIGLVVLVVLVMSMITGRG